MGAEISGELQKLLEDRKILKIRPDKKLISKEFSGAEYDLARARKSAEIGDYKWATVQAYYAMFHAARALLFSAGYREKSHTALRIALKELFGRSGKISAQELRNFEEAMELREDADYRLDFTASDSTGILEDAAEFLVVAKSILRMK